MGTTYSVTMGVAGGTAPYVWTVDTGSLPGGLTLLRNGVLSGTCTTMGSFSFTAKVTDAAAQTATATMEISVTQSPLVITTLNLPDGHLDAPYSTTLAAAGGTTPYSWSLVSGTLPPSLIFNGSTGTINGTPVELSTNIQLIFKVTDSTTPTPLTQSVNLTLAIRQASAISVSLSPARGGITVNQQLLFTAIVANDIGAAGVTWTATAGGGFNTHTATNASFSSPTAGVYTITATSVADASKSASVTIGVTDLPGVFTYHNNLSRDGSNPREYALTITTISASTFGKLFSCTVDGAIYTQPLWVANLTINGSQHNVVFVATQHDSLYAFDADASPCVTLWHVNLIDVNHGGTAGEISVPADPVGYLVGSGFGDIMPEVGITGTPVIDPTSRTLYVVSKSVIPSGPIFYQRLHAIDLITGNEEVGSPVVLAGSYPGTGDGSSITSFHPREENQRAGLALVNGLVYIAWGSHEDTAPFYGWVMAYNAKTLEQVATFNVDPNVGYGGIWMSGGAPAADSSNALYLITSNGTFDANTSTSPQKDYADSFLKLSSGLTVLQYFTPSDQAGEDSNNNDFGSGGAAILVDEPSAPVPHLVIGGGKDGYLYLLNRDAMGGIGDSNSWQRFDLGNSIFATGAFWNGRYYLAGVSGHLRSYSFDSLSGKFDVSNIVQSAGTFGYPGSTPSVSASGSSNGIVWALDNSSFCTLESPSCGPAILHAYDAMNVTSELWNSAEGAGNTAGNAVKFTVPTVANGKVYVATRGNNSGGDSSSSSTPGELDVYGLLP
jgi:hypothetical protein